MGFRVVGRVGRNLGESPEEAGISASASITAAAVSVDDIIEASIIPHWQLLAESADPGCAADASGAVVATSTSQ